MTETRKKATINLAKHPDFPATNDCAIMTSQDLAKHTNALFSRVFADYAGCKIIMDQQQDPNTMQLVLNQNHPVQLELYFALGNSTDENKKLYAFKPISDKVKEQSVGGKMNYIERCMGHNIAITQNKSSEITQDAIDIFSSMLWYEVAMRTSANPSPKEFNNLGIVVEATTVQGQTPYMTPNTQKYVYNVVKFVDINSVLAMLFGNADDGSQMIYQVVPIKPIINTAMLQMIPNTNEQKWLFNVMRINQQNISDLFNELGAYNVTNGINIYTDKY